MTYHRPADRYTKKAKAEGYAARSVYKLEEIDRRAKLFRAGMTVLDLGAAPGSWTQFVSQRIGAKGRVVALDRVPLRADIGVAANVEFVLLDVFAGDARSLLPGRRFDLVLSDMAPKATGIRDTDLANSFELASRAVEIAAVLLVPAGSLLVKAFHGDGFEELRAAMRRHFGSVRILKPEASRRESSEVYLLAEGRLPDARPDPPA